MASTSQAVATSDKPTRRRGPRKKRAPAPRKPSAKLSELMAILAFQGENEEVWSTLASFRWFIRNNREELIAKGALLEISGRAFVHVENFKAVVLAVGRAQAMKAGAAVDCDEGDGDA